MNEVRKNGIRVVRANSKDLDRIFALFAAAQEVRMAEEQMENRFRAIPGGWRDLRLIRTLLDKLTTNLVSTLQSEKLVSMKRMLPRMKFRVVCGTEATRVQEDEVILAMREVGDRMDVSLRETGLGGIAGTPFGQAMSERMAAEAEETGGAS